MGNAYEPYSTLTEMRTDGSGFNMFQRGADDKETLFKAMKEMDSSPERESVLRYMEYINGSFIEMSYLFRFIMTILFMSAEMI